MANFNYITNYIFPATGPGGTAVGKLDPFDGPCVLLIGPSVGSFVMSNSQAGAVAILGNSSGAGLTEFNGTIYMERLDDSVWIASFGALLVTVFATRPRR